MMEKHLFERGISTLDPQSNTGWSGTSPQDRKALSVEAQHAYSYNVVPTGAAAKSRCGIDTLV